MQSFALLEALKNLAQKNQQPKFTDIGRIRVRSILEGRPLFVLRLGQMDIKGLLRAIGEDGLVKFVLSTCEEGLKKTQEATKRSGKPIRSVGSARHLEMKSYLSSGRNRAPFAAPGRC